jgi:hypothetical protein
MSDHARPDLPLDELRNALGDHPEGLAATDALHASVNHETPNAEHITEHVHTLRGIPAAEAVIANWYESEPVQRFVLNLTNAGL